MSSLFQVTGRGKPDLILCRHLTNVITKREDSNTRNTKFFEQPGQGSEYKLFAWCIVTLQLTRRLWVRTGIGPELNFPNDVFNFFYPQTAQPVNDGAIAFESENR